jgi:cathepsin C
MIYNQGLEIWANGVIHFAFSAYDSAGQSICGKSQVGWSHSADGTQWRCLQIIKTSEDASSTPASKRSQLDVPASDVAAQQLLHARRESERLSRKFSTDHSFLAKVNKAAKGQFTVREYPEFNGLTIGALERRRGTVRREGALANPFEMLAPEAGVEPAVHHPKRHHQHVALQSASSKSVPASFDWRNVNGVNYVSPVRDQGQCGSCYAFSAAGMMEARIRVRSNNTQQPILSTQDVVSCSLYRYATTTQQTTKS